MSAEDFNICHKGMCDLCEIVLGYTLADRNSVNRVLRNWAEAHWNWPPAFSRPETLPPPADFILSDARREFDSAREEVRDLFEHIGQNNQNLVTALMRRYSEMLIILGPHIMGNGPQPAFRARALDLLGAPLTPEPDTMVTTDMPDSDASDAFSSAGSDADETRPDDNEAGPNAVLDAASAAPLRRQPDVADLSNISEFDVFSDAGFEAFGVWVDENPDVPDSVTDAGASALQQLLLGLPIATPEEARTAGSFFMDAYIGLATAYRTFEAAARLPPEAHAAFFTGIANIASIQASYMMSGEDDTARARSSATSGTEMIYRLVRAFTDGFTERVMADYATNYEEIGATLLVELKRRYNIDDPGREPERG